MHVHGDADDIVPLSANSQILYDRYIALGGEMTLSVKRGDHGELPVFFQDPQMLAFMMADSALASTATCTRDPRPPSSRLGVGFSNDAIRAGNKQSAYLSACDLSGRLLVGAHINSNGNLAWYTNEGPHGMYLCRLSADDRTVSVMGGPVRAYVPEGYRHH
jgi:hypothetical protein